MYLYFSGGGGDPHFIQIIKDISTNKSIPICYDVTGNAGQSIFILEDKLTSTKVYGVLLDDYYMHTIKIIHRGEIYAFGTRNITINRQQSFPWPEDDMFKKINELFKFDVIKDKINIQIKSEMRNHKLEINLKRTSNKLTGDFLDVYFNEFYNNYKRYNGILGHIGKQIICLIEPIQDTSKALIKLNNQLVPVEHKKRSIGKCWFVQFEDIISPLKANDFVF